MSVPTVLRRLLVVLGAAVLYACATSEPIAPTQLKSVGSVATVNTTSDPSTTVCMDPNATNFHQALPCVFPPATCEDRTALNFHQGLPCLYPPAVCEDPQATNYHQALPCQYPPTPVCEDPNALNYHGTLPCQYPPQQLCEDTNATNYHGALPCVYPPPVCEDQQATNYNNGFPCTYSTPDAPCIQIHGIVGRAITPVTLEGRGGHGGPYTYSAIGLPPGLSLSSDGTFSGTPTIDGDYNITLTVTDNAGMVGTKTCIVNVQDRPTANCVSITAIAGVPITPVTLTARGGNRGPYTFSATGLPAGLTMSSDGTISGTPTVSGQFGYVVTVTDSDGNVGTTNCSVDVTPRVDVTCQSIVAVAGVPITPVSMSASGGSGGPYTYSATGLPPGLSMSTSGVVSGTPTVTGSFTYTVTVTDSQGHTGTSQCSVTVNPPPRVEVTCQNIVAVALTPIAPVQLNASGGVGGPYTFSATGLPAGLSISSSGVISGTPSVTGTFGYTVTVTDRNGNSGTATCSVTLNPPGKTFTIGPSSMEGAIRISNGDWVNGGYSFKFKESTHTATNFTVTAYVTITGPCSNGGMDVVTVPLGMVTYNVPAGNTNWLPTGDANSVLSWQGSVKVGVNTPPICGGVGTLNASKGAVYTATVSQNPPSGSLVDFRFKYRDPAAKGKPNTNCLDTSDPNRAKADVCGASWSATVLDP